MNARKTYAANLRVEACKELPLRAPVQSAPALPLAVVALDQGGGISAQPLVRPGDRVCVGSLLASGDQQGCSNVHSPVAGLVTDIEMRAVAAGIGLCVVVENDGSDKRDPELAPVADFLALSPEKLLARFREAGIAGLGGAAFPTATKLSAAQRGETVTLILNGAECEPWICCDDALMREASMDVLVGAQTLMHVAGANRCTIAIEDDKPEAFEAMQAALDAATPQGVELVALPSLYPSGAERQLITALTGQEVPKGGLPTDIGVLCQNVGTAAAIARFLRTGEPLISRIVTVTGSGVARPANVEAFIGTPMAALIEHCGGYQGEPLRLIEGGSMMGRAVASDEAPMTKATSCIIAACDADLVARTGPAACIRCGDCAHACPAGLLPQELHRLARVDDLAGLEFLGVEDCILCGCCDYVCPSQIPLTEQFRTARQAARQLADEQYRAEAARQRFDRRERRLRAQAEADRQTFEDARRRARADSN